MISKTINTCCLFSCLLIGGIVVAQSFSDEFSSNQITSGTTLPTVTASFPGTSATDVDPYTYITLEINENQEPFTAYRYITTLQVTPIQPDGSSAAATTLTLEVENNNVMGAGNTVDLQQHLFPNTYGASIQIISTSFEDIENGLPPEINNNVPASITLTVGFNTTRFYELPNIVPNISHRIINNQLEVVWSAVPRARYYDLEWTWVDNYDFDESPKSSSQIYFSEQQFKRNNTRVQTHQTQYRIPLTYAQGYIIFRVRAVGNFLADLTKNKYGPWSSGTGTKTFISNWYPKYLVRAEHEATINWQFQASYAEEGKKKEVISYFDGTLRNLQTVTKINTDDTAIVGEVIYDAQGRPAVEVLPVPTLNNQLTFHPHIRSKNTAGLPYTYLDFDKDNQNIVDITSDEKALNTSTGASEYYSPNNVFTNAFRNRIPDAEGYPFSQIEYTPDNTGRIRRKGGVGKAHQLGTKHEMEYFYGVPEQKELNRLFGYSVGNASMYKKNMVLDPNNQLSISYIDPQGRTIATALAGKNPEHVIGLEDEADTATDTDNVPLHDFVLSDLLAKVNSDDPDTHIDNNQLETTGNFAPLYDRLTFNTVKTAVFDEDRTFDYSITNAAFQLGCIDTTYPFVYDLKIDIRNEDAQSILPTVINETIDFGAGNTLNFGGITGNTYTLDPITIPVERGTFSINKILTVNSAKAEKYADEYMEAYRQKILDSNDPCYIESIANIEPIEIDGCFISKTACEQSVLNEYPTEDYYLAQRLANYKQETLDALSTSERIQLEASLKQQWHDALAECASAFSDGSVSAGDTQSISCQIVETQLLDDMLPIGQYGNTTSDLLTGLLTDLLTIYNTNNKLLSTKTANITHNSWKNPRHPEYDPLPSSGLYTNGHYYNDDGTISKIKVTYNIVLDDQGNEDPNASYYQPAIDDNASITPTQDVDFTNQYWVEPQYLTDVQDFLSNAIWNDNWVYSLIVYHPEYAYFLYTKEICAKQLANNNASLGFFNSDGYDTYILSINSYEEATSATHNLLSGSNELAIFQKDPYFQNQLNLETSELYVARRQIMQLALKENYDGSTEPLIASAYGNLVCNSIMTCNLTTAQASIISAMNTETDEAVKNKLWNTYKTHYLGLKQRIKSLFLNVYTQKYGSYNGCIGVSQAPVSLVATMSAYPNEAAVVNSYLSGKPSGLCDYEAAGNYITKQKRFIPSDMFYNAGAAPTDSGNDVAELIAYNYYINTGTCPLARDLVLYLDGFFNESNDSGVDPTAFNQPYTGQYLTPRLFEEFGGSFPAALNSVEQLGNATGQTLTLQLQVSGIGTLANSSVTVKLPVSYNWGSYGSWKIITVNTITTTYNQTTAEFIYTALAKIETSSSSFEEIIISGSTKAGIGACSADNPNTDGDYLGDANAWDESGDCNKETYVSKAFVNLFNNLVRSGEINGSGVDITTNPSYADSYLAEFFGATAPVIWNNTANVYTLRVGGTQKFIMQLNQPIPHTATLTHVGFKLLFNNANELTGQEIKVTWQNADFSLESNQGTVAESSTRLLNFLCCGDMNTYYDTTPCKNKTCEEVMLQALNYLKSNNLIDRPQAPIYLSNEVSFYANTCFDEYYNLTDKDLVVWEDGTQSYSYVLLVNDIVVFQIESAWPGLSSSEIVTFTNLDSNNIRDSITYIDTSGDLIPMPTKNLALECDCNINGLDDDCDGILSDNDNCKYTHNPNQLDSDGDGIGDVCDPCNSTGTDDDCDGVLNNDDNCRNTPNPNQLDVDGDGIGDVCDDELYCYSSLTEAGIYGIYIVDVLFENDAQGKAGLEYDSRKVPDQFQIIYGGETVADSKFVGDHLLNNYSNWRQRILNLNGAEMQVFRYISGRFVATEGDTAIFNVSEDDFLEEDDPSLNGNGVISFKRVDTSFDKMTIVITAPLFNITLWDIKDFICPGDAVPFSYSSIDDKSLSANKAVISRAQLENYSSDEYTNLINNKEDDFLVEGVDFYAPTNNISRANSLSYSVSSAQALKILDDCPGAPCIPQPIEPVSCTEKYPLFINTLQNIGDYEQLYPYPEDSALQFTEADFCNQQLAYIYEGYAAYLQKFTITNINNFNDPNNLYYLTIKDFGATPFNYGYNNMASVIDAYEAHVSSTPDQDDIKTWSAFTGEHFQSLETTNGGCHSVPPPPHITTNNISITPPETSSCLQMAQSISNSYTQDGYDQHIADVRQNFIKTYVKKATENAVENFDMLYYDKEYQYTLYYYDQAGNLIQTVPPQGVKRFSEQVLNDDSAGPSLNNQINSYRLLDTQSPQPENTLLLPQHKYKTEYKYNSLNQLVWQYTPDGGITKFAYDALGRIIASQNAKQLINNTFSYTMYDALGRIIEAGELIPNTAISIKGSTGKLVYTANDTPVEAFVVKTAANGNPMTVHYPNHITTEKNEVTITKYTRPVHDAAALFNTVTQVNPLLKEHSRNRVTAIYHFNQYSPITPLDNYNNAIFYNYDSHGNVIEVAQDNKLFPKSATNIYAGIKHVQYEYDLISGNVNKVYYQKEEPDQFIHKYTYDADNRIVKVETSSDGYIWENDAHYAYYNHGPLARVLLGNEEVQGLDYAYTLQGWLKGINSDTLNPTNDMGEDAKTGNVAADAMGFGLSYFQDDYKPIGSINAFVNGTNQQQNPKNLYNGNIKQMTTALMHTNGTTLPTQLNNYQYDQLNRIKDMKGYSLQNGISKANYMSNYNYDNNGNLKVLNRTAVTGLGVQQAMDNLQYTYKTKVHPTTGKVVKTNQLDHVKDAITATNFNDIGSQNPGNYTYDAIGQLLSDTAEGITNIDWRVDGKVAKITKQDATEILFHYDGLGNRIAKTLSTPTTEDKTTLYTRDAQGNVMAVYDRIGNINGVSQPNYLELNNNAITDTQGYIANVAIQVAPNGNPYTVEYPNGDLTLTAGQSISMLPGFHTKPGSAFQTQISGATATEESVIFLKEHHIYGSSRLGLESKNLRIDTNTPPSNTTTISRVIGDKRYELTNHLGNVLTVISDKKLASFNGDSFNGFKPEVIAFSDYYPFGMLLPNRHGSRDSYRYGFQGQEMDDELRGKGNSYDYGFRIYSPRIGKFLSVDPMTKGYPMLTPYQYASNNPIMLIDIDGLEGGLPADLGNVFGSIEQGVASMTTTMSKAWDSAMQKLGSLFSQEESTKQVDATPSNTTPPAEANAEKVMNTPVNEPKVSTGDMISPVKDPYITSEQSASRKHPKSGKVKPHNGADIVTKTRETTNGAPIVAPADGKVYVKTKVDGNGAGNRIHMFDKKGNKHSFFHLQDGMNVKSGQNVKQGDTIGKIGTTGTTTAPHLHYEIRDKKGKVLNPREANPVLKDAPTR